MGRPPDRPRELLVCPGCGLDLDQARPKRIGDLYADPLGDTYWKGRPVHLSSTQRLIVDGLVTVRPYQSRRDKEAGYFVSAIALAERSDLSVDSVNVEISRIRGLFRQVDPDFNHIEVSPGAGWRWSEQIVRKVVAAMGPWVVLYDTHEVEWRRIYRIFLSPKEAVAMRLLIEARGEYVGAEPINLALGWNTPLGAKQACYAIRRKFAKADPATPIMELKKRAIGGRSVGYRIVRAVRK
jgi:hypothetical protein